MPRGEKDHGTNWMIQHHSRALLRLVGLAQVRSCRAAHARLTLPQALPDGLLEVVLPDQPSPLSVLLEIEAYPSQETEEQMARDMDLARMALGALPDAVLLVLCPRGNQKQASKRQEHSPFGWSTRRHGWKVVELRKVPAEVLLALDEVGLTPLLPLTRSKQSPETLVQQSKERIERQASPAERPTLLTITAIMASMRSGTVEGWLALLGGKNVVEHSPLYQHWMQEERRATNQAAIVRVLEARFGAVPEELGATIRSVSDLDKLEQAITLAAKCSSLEQFQKRFAKL